MGSLYNGITGLNNHQTALDVESNNIANVNTVGFKSDTVSFADLMYQQNGTGTGSSILDIQKQERLQGTLKSTGNEYDFAINGAGYFTVVDPDNAEEIYYTRAGNFKMDLNGFLTTADDFPVQGVSPTVSGTTYKSDGTTEDSGMITTDFTNYIATGVIIEGNDSVESVNVYSTNYKLTVAESGVSGTNYKSKLTNINDIEALSDLYETKLKLYGTDPDTFDPGTEGVTQLTTVEFGNTANSSGDFDLKISIGNEDVEQLFDTDVETTLNKFTDKISAITGMSAEVDTTTGTITIESMFAGEKVVISNASTNDISVNITELREADGMGKALADTLFTKLIGLINQAGGDVVENNTKVDKVDPNTSNPEFTNIQLNMDTLGVSQNMFGELSMENGILYLKDGEAKFVVAQLTPVFFPNGLALNPNGENKYTKTTDSGDPIYIKQKSEIENGVLELSTSDLSTSLVNLMVYQRAFDANSKSVTTSDQMLQTAINLKKS
jgi:flagellar hook protein FlgE